MLGEARGAVEVSIESTVVALIGLAAGYGVREMTQGLVDRIRAHAAVSTIAGRHRHAIGGGQELSG